MSTNKLTIKRIQSSCIYTYAYAKAVFTSASDAHTNIILNTLVGK